MNEPVAASMNQPIEIKTRRMSFPFEQVENRYFFDDNKILSAWAAALSSTFPAGEGEFIDSVRNYQDQVEDPDMQARIREFIHQEGQHSGQHRRANEALKALGFDAPRLEAHLKKDIRLLRKQATPKFRLALTAGMEHITAIMADFLLRYPQRWGDIKQPVMNLLQWHAVEEIEHKAVAFDVYMHCENDQRHLRKIYRLVSWMFCTRITLYSIALLWWARAMPTWRDFRGFFQFMFGKQGLIRTIRPAYQDYKRPGFHPWDHDNRDLVEHWKQQLYQPEQDRDHPDFQSGAAASSMTKAA